MQIIVKLTTACNLACTYCSEGDSAVEQLPKELVYKMIDEYPALLDHIGTRSASILWHGGEPLLVGHDYLHDVMCYARDRLRDYDVHFLMQTNGTLVDEDWLALFREFSISAGVSLDGYRDLHDRSRRTHDGDPTFDTVYENIVRMRDAGVLGGSLMVLDTTQPVDVDVLFAFLQESGIPCKIHPVIPCGRAEGIMDSDAVYQNYIALMKELCRRSLALDEPTDINPLSDLMQAVLADGTLNECSYSGRCGDAFLCLYASGQMGICGRTSNMEGCIYGDLREMSLLAAYQSANAERVRERQSYLKEHDCASCTDWDLCHGGCSFEAAHAYGTLEHRYPSCRQRHALLEFIRTEGLDLLKEHLLRKKRRQRILLQEKRKLLEELKYARK